MSVRDLIPWGRSASRTPAVYRETEHDPFLTLHREMNRLFDDIFRGFETRLPSLGGTLPGAAWPHIEVSDTAKEIVVTAELPGLEEKDVELTLDDGLLTLRGERRAQTEDKDRHFSERFYGRFERRLALPAEVEEDRVEASFRNGVLTVRLPKSAKAQAQVRRIEIKG